MLTREQENKLKQALNLGQTTKGDFIKINRAECITCGVCTEVCPTGALSIQNDKIDISGDCVGCEACIESCPVDAIASYNKE